jgi:hypothetical protein
MAMGRRIVQVGPGLLRIEQRLGIPGVEIGTDVAGPACIYAVVTVRRGSVIYQQGASRVVAARRLALFLPPFSIVQASLEHCDVTSVAVAFRPLASDDLPRGAGLWLLDKPAPASRADVLEPLRIAGTSTNVGRDRNPAPLAANAKAVIDRESGASLEITRIAARRHVSPAVLSRAFRRTSAIQERPPSEGLQHFVTDVRWKSWPIAAREPSVSEETLLSRITADPAIFGGKPIIRGRRLAVDHVLGMLTVRRSAITVRVIEGFRAKRQNPYASPAN